MLSLVMMLMGELKLDEKSSTDQILDALNESGQHMTSLAADVELITTDDLGDDTTRSGKFVILRSPDGDSKARLALTKVQKGNKIFEERQEFVLEGPNLIRRMYQQKKQITDRVRKPGEKVNLLKLGQGPFPLPIGQPREDVLKEFDISVPDKIEPKLEHHAVIRLSPKADTRFARKFKSIDLWVDESDNLPKRIVTVNPNGDETKTAILKNVRLNADVKPEELKLEPLPDDWTTVDEGYQE